MRDRRRGRHGGRPRARPAHAGGAELGTGREASLNSLEDLILNLSGGDATYTDIPLEMFCALFGGNVREM